MTQCERIVRHLHDFGEISSLTAMQDYGIMRLASRIADLRDQGYDISAERRTSKNRYGESTTYAVYKLKD